MNKEHLPRSSTARFSEMWQTSVGDAAFLDEVVERWRTSGSGACDDHEAATAMMMDALDASEQQAGYVATTAAQAAAPAQSHGQLQSAAHAAAYGEPLPQSGLRKLASAQAERQAVARQLNAAPQPQQGVMPSLRRGSLLRSDDGSAHSGSGSANTKEMAAASSDNSGATLRSLREKLMQR